MRTEEEQFVKVSSNSTTDDIDNRTFKYHEQFQQLDNIRMLSKVKPGVYFIIYILGRIT